MFFCIYLDKNAYIFNFSNLSIISHNMKIKFALPVSFIHQVPSITKKGFTTWFNNELFVV